MKENFKKSCVIISAVTAACLVMAYVETVAEPVYRIKSAIKAAVFTLLPFGALKIAGSDGRKRPKKGVSIPRLALLGLGVYFIIICGYFLTKNFFDYKTLVNSLARDQQVGGFLPVAAYICFCNSFLEEFIFRFAAFLRLSEYSGKRVAYIFSRTAFALYHIGITGKSFPLPLLIITTLGLLAGGIIFDYIDGDGHIYNSWAVHMFRDFAVMTVWYLNMT